MNKFGNHYGALGPEGIKPNQDARVSRPPLEIPGRSIPRNNLAIHGHGAQRPSSGSSISPQGPKCIASRSVRSFDPSKIPLPVDIRIHARRQGLVGQHVHGLENAFKTKRNFDRSTPRRRSRPYEKLTGKQVNMISRAGMAGACSITSSLLANWDGGADNEQYRRLLWDGKELAQKFEVDFSPKREGSSAIIEARLQGRCAPLPQAR